MAVRAAFLFAALLGLLAAPPARAGGVKEINWSKLREVSRRGPFTITLRDKVSFRVPSGYRFVTEDKLDEFHRLMGDAALPEEAGVVLPEDGGWVAAVTFPKDDPLAGQDPKQLSRDVLLKWNEKAVDEARPKRSAAGLPGTKVTGFTHNPAFDADAKRLTMGVRVTEDGERATGTRDELHYKTLVYGPDGAFVCLHTVAPVGYWDKPIEESKKLAGEFSYPQAGDGAEEDDSMYFAKIGGAGLIGVVVVILGAKLVNGRRPAPTPTRPAARRFGTPR